jgi:hypothetical protein
MYCRPSARWLTSPRCSSRTSIVATVVSASRRPVIARWTSVTDASSRDHSTRMTASCSAVRRGGGADAFRGMPEYYTRRRRTASQGGSEFDGQAQVCLRRSRLQSAACERGSRVAERIVSDLSTNARPLTAISIGGSAPWRRQRARMAQPEIASARRQLLPVALAQCILPGRGRPSARRQVESRVARGSARPWLLRRRLQFSLPIENHVELSRHRPPVTLNHQEPFAVCRDAVAVETVVDHQPP